MTRFLAGGRLAVLVLSAAILGGCAGTAGTGGADGAGTDSVDGAGTDGAGTGGADGAGTDAVVAPPPGSGFDYQLGGPYDPPEGATVVVRDRTAPPAGAGYDVCYVNGFQTQPDASAAFARDHPDLLIQVDGEPLVDPGWPDEYLFDTSTAENRRRLAAVVGPWIKGCRESGYDGVEIDNLDAFLRSEGATTASDNLALAEEYARIAHDAGLAIAQKNTPDLSAELRAAGYDFAVAESCREFDECAAYTAEYGTVLDIEYTDELGADGFDDSCADPDRPSSMILRDPELVTPEDPAYRYASCGR